MTQSTAEPIRTSFLCLVRDLPIVRAKVAYNNLVMFLLRNAGAFILTMTIFLLASEARASFQDGNALAEDCAKSGSFSSGFCSGYITAIADAARCGHPVDGFSWRPPPNVKLGQVTKVVIKYMKEHPQLLHYSAPGIIASALEDVWPCQ